MRRVPKVDHDHAPAPLDRRYEQMEAAAQSMGHAAPLPYYRALRDSTQAEVRAAMLEATEGDDA